jgi:hypothetical protein
MTQAEREALDEITKAWGGADQFFRWAVRVMAGVDPHRAAEAGRKEREEEENHGQR